MKVLINTIFFLAIILSSCKKIVDERPVNTPNNNVDLDCATCPSLFHEIVSVNYVLSNTCDDFTTAPWPAIGVFGPGELIGLTQDETQTVIVGEGGSVEFGTDSGIFVTGDLDFSFDGSVQTVRFETYAIAAVFGVEGFTINDEFTFYLDAAFPLDFGDITVSIDYSPADTPPFTSVFITISGAINEITHIGLESGITELCVTKILQGEIPEIDKTEAIYFNDFFNYNGEILGNYPNEKTPLGYFGNTAANLSINFNQFLAYEPTQISFVHAYPIGNSNLVNVKLPNSTQVITVPDSLNFYLSPFGYSAINYAKEEEVMWVNGIDPPLTNALLDSIVISGNNLQQIEVGANLQGSELRSICTYYEYE